MKKENRLEPANLDKEQQTISRNHLKRNILQTQQSCILELENCKNQAIKDTIHLLYIERLFDLFENKDQIFHEYLTFTNQYLFEKFGTEIQTSDGVYYLSDLDYSTRQTVLNTLKKTSRKI